MKILSFFIFLASFNSYSQELPSFKEIQKEFNKNKDNEKVKEYRFLNKTKEGKFKVYCYQDGKKIDRYYDLEVVSYESKLLYYDIITKDNRVIRLPFNSCFVESVGSLRK